MATQTTAANLKEALGALYHHPDGSVRRQANGWLEKFQQTPEAWQVSDSLLHDPESSNEVHYFCAQTLKKKAQRDYEELPQGVSRSLRDSCITLLLRFGSGSPAVRTQLSLALVALVAQMPAADWDNMGQLQWLAQRFSQEAQQVALPCLLELLVLLPQESNGYPSMWPDQRRRFLQSLLSATADAFNLLVSCMQMAGGAARVQAQVIEAFGAWVRLGAGRAGEKEDGARTLPEPAALAQHPLTLAALAGLESEPTYDAAVDAVSELIRSTRVSDPEAEEVDPAQVPLVGILVSRVMTLLPRFVAASRASADLEGDHGAVDDDETAKGMARLFAEVGEAFVGLISTGAAETTQPVEALLEVAAYPEDNVSFMCFEFWNKLSRSLQRKVLPRVEGGAEAAAAEQARRVAFFKPAFVRLIQSIQGRVRYPDGFDHWRKDQKAEFKRARYMVADTLMDAAQVVGGAECLALLVKPLEKLSLDVSQGQAFEWRAAEAALYCIRSVARAAPPPGDPLLAGLLAMLPTLPAQPQLMYTSCLTIAAYADWFAASATVGNTLGLTPQLLTLLTSSLNEEDAANAAALALKHLCDACAAHLQPFLDGLMQLYTAEMRDGGCASKLDNDDLLQVLQGLCLVVSSLPPDQVAAGATYLIKPVVQQLETLLPAEATPSHGSHGGLVAHVDRLAHVFRYITCPQVTADLLRNLWPLLERALISTCSDERLAERLCRL
eukprot:CAMPEP_0118943288 /NCGR_PEP_ID=MMETSP1169-20130426/38014_1 /TAXON_ID=36882 /ORGANISM="Pyramimonas obovata, Strain CCMP722" /LENGTH=723 /DNA_ID=CAMNT_0006888509 /DNA_START=206 /DNA_END=2373 /DNA_ORIENTATION=-